MFCVCYFKGAFSGLRKFLATKSPLKMIKNAFYFISKILFVLRIFKFLSWFFGHVSKDLIEKIRLISNFMMSQPGWQIILIHIFPNISRSKGNPAMNFGQLIECNIRNISLEKSYTKCRRETSPKSFAEKLELSISLDQQY